MNIELLQESKDAGRKVVPFQTRSGLQIGRCYTPKTTITQAQCIEHYKPRNGYGTAWWIAFCAVSVLALFVIVRTA